MSVPLEHYLAFAAVIFAIGVYGVLVRRNVIAILISIELILNAVNVNLIAFSRFTSVSAETGQIFAVFIITMAAAAVAVGLAIVIALYRIRKTVYADEINLLKW